MNISRLTLVAVALLATPVAGSASEGRRCLNGLREGLATGGFTGSMDCRRDRLTINRIGSLGPRDHVVTVYDYRYRLAPACAECAVHGGQRILFFKRGRYIGQYKPDPLRLAIRHGRLVMTPMHWAGSEALPTVSVTITREGPPGKVLVDGELLELFR